MKISVIIPTYNEVDRICDIIYYLKANSNPENIKEIIVVDCCSEDKTFEMAECHDGVTTILSKQKGRAIQMNIGAHESSGEILYFLHADSFPPKNFDKYILDKVEQGVESGCYRMRFDSKHHLLRFSGWCTRFNINLFRGGDQSLFITYRLFESLGGFDESLTIMEDCDMVARIRERSRFAILPHQLVTSARKYRRNGYYRLQFLFSMIHLMYRIGYSQQSLIQFYSKHIS